MLSRLAVARSGALFPLLSKDAHQRLVAALPRYVSTSPSSPSDHAAVKPAGSGHDSVPSTDGGGDIQRTLAQWDAAHKIYFGPERDTVNFPIKEMPLTNPPVRLGFIPETWFQAFYDKTGATGPYLFGGGLITYCLSKEIWIIEHNFTHFLSFWIAFYILARKMGPGLAKYFDQQNEALENRTWWAPLNKAKQQYEETIIETEKNIWREEGQKYLFAVKKENVDLQLESVYRQRLAEIHQSVKKRLDYQVDILNSTRRIQQQHMVQWIVDGVMAGITPQQEKDSMTKCIDDLKALAAKHAATA
jgi:F-type H+-transporting ATPase subunit b